MHVIFDFSRYLEFKNLNRKQELIFCVCMVIQGKTLMLLITKKYIKLLALIEYVLDSVFHRE